MNSNIGAWVRLQAMSLPIGQTMGNQICPACGGGSSHKPTLAITRYPDKLAYICYRASCNIRGYIDDFRNADLSRASCNIRDTDLSHATMGIRNKKIYKVKPYTGRILKLSRDDTEYFYKRFRLTPTTSYAHIRVNDSGEYLFPIYDLYRKVTGWVKRQPVWSGIKCPRKTSHDHNYPKAMTYMHETRESVSLLNANSLVTDSRPVVVVEDQVSQLKAYQANYSSVALLGTGMNLEVAREIQSMNPSGVVIALDNDAIAKAFKIAKDYGLIWKNVRVAPLPADLKDLSREQFYEILGDPDKW